MSTQTKPKTQSNFKNTIVFWLGKTLFSKKDHHVAIINSSGLIHSSFNFTWKEIKDYESNISFEEAVVLASRISSNIITGGILEYMLTYLKEEHKLTPALFKMNDSSLFIFTEAVTIILTEEKPHKPTLPGASIH